MNQNEPVLVKSTEVAVKSTKELQKIVATELLYNSNEECLEELFEKGKIIGRTTDTRDNN
jgi:hypothetical protein